MSSVLSAEGEVDYVGAVVLFCDVVDKGDSPEDIPGIEGPALSPTRLDRDDGGSRSNTSVTWGLRDIGTGISRGNSGDVGSVSQFVAVGEFFLSFEGLFDLLFLENSRRFAGVGIWEGEVQDGEDAGSAVWGSKCGVGVIDSGIYNSDDYAASVEVELAVNLGGSDRSGTQVEVGGEFFAQANPLDPLCGEQFFQVP